MVRWLCIISLATVFSACSSTTKQGEVDADRKQLLLVPNSQILNASAQAYNQTKAEAQQKGILNTNPEQVRRVQEIAKRLLPQVGIFRKDAVNWNWEVNVITSPQLNAYCMPGGKIMFYSGIIEKLQMTDGEIAAVMGHEMAHALREHGRERMSRALLQQTGLQILLATGTVNPNYAGALQAFTQVAVGLPNDRGQESEADDMGLELMARAGFDPSEAAQLWRKMSAVSSGGKPPALLSTHPTDAKRIRRIESLLPKVMPLYQAAKK